MRIFITGTAGFIGFHLARRQLEAGHTVAGFDGLTPYYDVSLKHARHAALAAYPKFTATAAMLEDRAALFDAARAAKPDIIVHLAAQAGVRYSLENPKAYVSSNLVGSWHVLELARELKPRHLLLASTSSVYGSAQTVPFHENDETGQPMTLYAASKRSMEVMAHSYAHLFAIPTTAFRFFTVYGPWGRPDMALFKFVAAILDGKPIEIYGEGRMQRDFTYVDDLVEAITRLFPVVPEAGKPAAPGDTVSHVAPFRVVNIGGGMPVDLLDFVKVVEAATGREAVRTMLPMQPGDVPRTYASPDLLAALTAYKPTTPVETGVRAFVDWYRDYFRRSV